MREIKFRAWQPHTSLHRKPGMYMVDDMVWYEKDSEGHTGEVFLAKHIGWSQSSEYIDEVKLMQYTGLKDKNGVEIYEGDIVRLKTGAIGFYEYSEPHLAFAVRLKEHDCGGDDFIISKLDGWYNFDVEVIGNIYENRELLDGGKE